ncbi:boophilin-H2-like [Ornithodoros turicata]|uniref:boophilin-H2-like n=1 Tax=Ornithodoros turicata TaxID=34597 RepID=UPI003139287D
MTSLKLIFCALTLCRLTWAYVWTPQSGEERYWYPGRYPLRTVDGVYRPLRTRPVYAPASPYFPVWPDDIVPGRLRPRPAFQFARRHHHKISNKKRKGKKDICRLYHSRDQFVCSTESSGYYYDSTMGRCTKVRYQGCQPTGNNFKTLRNCKNHCEKKDRNKKHASRAVCNKRHIKGRAKMCFKTKVMFFYNKKKGRCERFFNRTCSRAPNNFDTMLECQKSCHDAPHRRRHPQSHRVKAGTFYIG